MEEFELIKGVENIRKMIKISEMEGNRTHPVRTGCYEERNAQRSNELLEIKIIG